MMNKDALRTMTGCSDEQADKMLAAIQNATNANLDTEITKVNEDHFTLTVKKKRHLVYSTSFHLYNMDWAISELRRLKGDRH